MPFTAWKREKKQTQKQKNLFSMNSEGFGIEVTNNSLNESK